MLLRYSVLFHVLCCVTCHHLTLCHVTLRDVYSCSSTLKLYVVLCFVIFLFLFFLRYITLLHKLSCVHKVCRVCRSYNSFFKLLSCAQNMDLSFLMKNPSQVLGLPGTPYQTSTLSGE